MITRCVECNHEELSVNAECDCGCHVVPMSDITPQPPPRQTDERPIFEQVIDDIRAKAEAGLAKYGTYLQVSNGRDHLADAYQEALDQSKYLKAAIAQRADLEARLAMFTDAAKLSISEECGMSQSKGETALRDALRANDQHVAAFLDRVRREGAAEGWREVAQWLRDGADHDSLLGVVSQHVWREQAKVADARAAELEAQQ